MRNFTPTAPQPSIPIFVGPRVVGHVRGDVFEKRVSAAKHFLRKPPAIAFDVSTLADAEQAGAVSVAVTDTDSGRVYCATLAYICAYGFRVSRGFGEQRALALHRWQVCGTAEPTPTPPAESEPQFSQESLL